MRKIICLLLFFSLMILTACSGMIAGQQVVRGSGKVTSENRPVSGITAVGHSTLGDLTVTLGDQESLTVEAEENLLPYLETTVSAGKLTIRNKTGVSLRPTQPVRYHLTVTSLQALANSSSGSITADKVSGKNIAISLSSSGDITVDEIQADQLTVNSSSSGEITIKGGQAGRQVVSLSSSGQYQAADLKSQTAQVTLSSTGGVNIWVTGQLTANLSSSGNVNYFGSPQLTQHSSGSGKAISKGSK